MKISLRVPTRLRSGSHEFTEGIVMVTSKSVYAIRLPNILDNHAFPTIYSLKLEDEIISSGDFLVIFLNCSFIFCWKLGMNWLPKDFFSN